jgi:hypothetical protein
MAWRLNDLVVGGELLNTRHYSTHGWLELRDQERPLMLHLTGNCDPDLKGWHIRFTAKPPRRDPAQPDEPSNLSDLAWEQIGPTGNITAARKVRVSDCPPTEMYIRAKLGEMPPTEWKRCLYLEWFSQNGRVVVELIDPEIEYVEFVAHGDGDESGEAQLAEAQPDDAPPTGGLSIQSIRLDDEGNVEIRDETPTPDDLDDDDQEDPYGLIPSELQQMFDADAQETDRFLDDADEEKDEEKPDAIREMELMDDLIEKGEGVPLMELFEGPLQLPHPDEVPDDEAEASVKMVLTHLAMFNVALDVCKHFSPRELYRLLVEKICAGERAYPELQGTGWVQHFSTSDFCPACDAELEREYEEEARRRKEHPELYPPPDATPSDDIPF